MDLIVALNKSEHDEIIRLNQNNTNALKHFLDKIELEFDDKWCADLTKMEYAMFIISIKKIQRGHKLCKRLLALAEAQDVDFKKYLESVERDVARYSAY